MPEVVDDFEPCVPDGRRDGARSAPPDQPEPDRRDTAPGPDPALLAIIAAVLDCVTALALLAQTLITARAQRRPARHAAPLDRPRTTGHHQGMAAQQPRRWADLDPAERARRQQQSQADRARAAAVGADENERRRRQSQSDRDRARARAADEHEEAMYRTVLGGDINFMDKHDW